MVSKFHKMVLTKCFKQVDQVETMKNNKNKQRINLIYLTNFGFTFMNSMSPLRSSDPKGARFLSTAFATLLFDFFPCGDEIRTFTNFVWLNISLGARAHRVTPCCPGGSTSKTNKHFTKCLIRSASAQG